MITAWDLREWSEAEIQQSERDGYLNFIGYADHVRCNGCHKGCMVEPTRVEYPDGRKTGVLICSDDEEGGRIELTLESMRYWGVNADKFNASSETQEPVKQEAKSQKNRPTKQEMENRNRIVIAAVIEIEGRYHRPPTVEEIIEKTGLERQQIYSTDAYKNGKIVKKGAKVTTDLTGSSITDSEYFSENSEQHGRARRRSKSQQTELDLLIEQQEQDDKSNFVP